MKLKRAIVAIVLVSAFAAPLTAGTFEDAVDAHARGDYAKALRLIRPLANDGNATAQFNLGLMYLTGQGVRQDYSAAAIWFRKAAEQGYAHAQSNLGILYRDGRGVAQDYTEAVMWFRKAADQGDAVAEFLLGNQYAFGKGVPQDYSEAMRWFRKAAEQGHPRAMHDLGVIYAKGLGVPQDYVRAHMWFSLSASQGEQRAVKALAMAEQRMTPAQINEARRLARDWKPATQPPSRWRSLHCCADDRYGSFASVWPDHGDFRHPVNGHSRDRRACLKRANSGHPATRDQPAPRSRLSITQETATDASRQRLAAYQRL